MLLSPLFAFFSFGFSINWSMIENALHKLRNRHFCVIGDVILDIFSYGGVTRMSPEAPVPVLDVKKRNEVPGGALNVCNNLRSLDASVEIIGVLGDDYEAFRLEYLCEKAGIKKTGLLRDLRRVTTSKTRFFDGAKALLRSDMEQRDPLPPHLEDKMLQEVRRALKTSDACIVQDYNKGVLTPRLIPEILRLAADADVPVFVDPKFDHVFSYGGAFLIKPNRTETERMSAKRIAAYEDAEALSTELREKLRCENLLITLGHEGMLLQTPEARHYYPARKLQTADITGAGDTVIAVLAALYSAGLPLERAAEFANRAAAAVCALPGVVCVRPEMLAE